MKRAIIGDCKLAIYFKGESGEDGEVFTPDDPVAVLLMLPGGNSFSLTGDCERAVKDYLWSSGGLVWRGKGVVSVEE